MIRDVGAGFTDNRVQGVILGCAGMVHLSEAMRTELGRLVVDSVEAAARCMRWLTAKAKLSPPCPSEIGAWISLGRRSPLLV